MPDAQLVEDIREAIRSLERLEERVLAREAENQKIGETFAEMRRLLNSGASGPISLSPTTGSTVTPTWQHVEAALTRLGGKKNVSEIHEELQRTGIKLARDTVRTAMMRKEDVFYRVSEGIYDLVRNRETDAA